MNKNRFRLIYNQARCLWMAVAETVKAHTVQGSGTRVQHVSDGQVGLLDAVTVQRQAYALKPIAFSLMLGLGMVAVIPHPLSISTAHADIVADQAAASTLRPIVMNAANGTPLVNIQTPSAAGVSRNVYSQFDVNSNGVILNNSRTNIETQLGGWVQANPYLAGGAAKVILNEVNSHNPSLLNGYIEVAGSRAQVVIANPAGISCNGCGFINAHRATLTTGTPILNNGSLLGYRVGGGNINLTGNGLDTSQANFTDVIARAVEVNAGIWANALNVTTGINQVNVASNGDITGIGTISPNTTLPDGSVNPTPNFAIDVAALGGMYAGKISMVGTEDGLGVRNAGTIGASVGEISITADGLLQNTGSLNAKTNIQLDTVALTGNGSIKADANISINLDSDYTHTGVLQAGGNLSLQTSGDINNQSTLLASQSLSINAQNINNTATGEIIGADTEVNAIGTLTNLGLIDGVNTYINANTLTNTQNSSLFGDHLSVKVANLSNTLGATIAARTQLDIGASLIENSSNGLLFSAGDLAIGGSLDNNHLVIGTASSLINDGSAIEALGNATFSVTDLQNLNADLVTQVVQTGTGGFDRFTPRGQSVILESGDYPGAHIGNVNVEWRSAGPYTFREYTRYLGTKTTYETQVVSSTPGQILAGGNMMFNGNVLNSDSQIIAGGNLDVSGATVQNLNSEGQITTSYSGTAYYYDWDGNDDDYDVDVIGAYNPANTVLTYNLSTSRLEGGSTPTGSGTTVTSAAVPVVTSSLFQPSPDVAASYLIESNPRFTNYRTWLSSDYMLSQLASDPATMQKRLGDGFYEQKLIREQINQLTGRRFLAGYTSDEAQYQALMDNGITTARALQLIPGVALTPEQTAQLTSDIMWLVEKTVTLPDGSTTRALVPQVYVKLQAGDLSPTTGIMAGNSVTMQLSGDLVNQGTIAGRNFISLDAQNIQNLGGQIQADTTLLKANNDINIIGGQVIAKDAMLLEAGNDINLRSTTQSSQNSSGASSFSRTNLDRVAGLYMDNPNAILIANAGNDANLIATTIINRGEGAVTQINAAQNINLGTVTIAEQNSSVRNAKNYVKHGGTQDIGSTIQTNGDIALNAGNDFNAKAANVASAAGAINVSANQDINITEGRETSNFDTARKVKKSGTFSSKTKTQRDVFESDNSISSNFSADNITLQAGSDLTVRGSNIVSDNGTNLNANNNINITSAQNTAYELHERKTKSSGLSASGASVSLGTSKLSTKQTTQSTSQTGSTVGSVEGDVNINSGKTYTQKASDVLTPQGDINISAQRVNIMAGTNTYNSQQAMKYKQSGITLAVSSSALNLAQNVVSTAQGTIESDSTGNKTLNALQTYANASTLMEQKDAIVSAAKAGDAQGVADAAGVRVSISIGSSKASSSSTTNATISQESLLKADGNISIKATQDNINIVGSEIKSVQNVTLDAAKDINLIASTDAEANLSKNKSSSASIGVSLGVGKNTGFSVDVAASRGKGNANSSSTTYNNSQVSAGEKLNLKSGNDTNLVGANISGKQVIANVGGDLNIESLQDSATSKAKQSNTGVGVSIPIGPATGVGSISQSKQNSNSSYASVYKQSGIKAGAEGFSLSVENNTDLKGGVVTSEASADKNQLVTGTLTTSNIQNHMDATASSSTTGLSTDTLSSKYAAVKGLANNLMNNGKANISDDSTTLSAIAPANIIITDETKQQSLTGKTTEETVATLNRDTTNTNRVLEKPDIVALQEKAQQKQIDSILLLNTVTALADDGIKKLSNPKLYKVFCTQEPCRNDQQANNKLIGEIALDIFINNPGMSAEDATKLAIEKITGPGGNSSKADPQYSGGDPNRLVDEINPLTNKEVIISNIQILPATLSELNDLPNEQKQNSTVFANGIFNNLQRGAELAIQQTPTLDPRDFTQLQRIVETGNVAIGDTYLVHTDKANNFIGEFIVAAIGKQAEVWGIATPAASMKADAIQALSTNKLTGNTDNSVFSVAHSRGTMTDSVMANLLGIREFYNPNLQFIEDNPAAQQERLEDRIPKITSPQNLYIWAPSHDPVSTFTGGYGSNYLGSLASVPTVFATSNSVHSSPGTGAVGSLTADVNKPFSYTNINIEQLNKTRAQQTQDYLTQRFNTPSSGYVAPQIDKIKELQQQIQNQSNSQMNGLWQSTSNTVQHFSISNGAYQKLMQLRNAVNEGDKQ
ncbi:hemagglutinin repeat-containing protein [Methylotenera sp. L2L1]|uniref:hemagglutinin repeat-containing protein n=1 Tax=Methylotenera sp. L2L1 TaxID=1502770 RepID=UPI00068D35EF|nr:hemagglutinin repeat-containing protein [Methylotenera sp. L2L1]